MNTTIIKGHGSQTRASGGVTIVEPAGDVKKEE
jgi:hypothetical protein